MNFPYFKIISTEFIDILDNYSHFDPSFIGEKLIESFSESQVSFCKLAARIHYRFWSLPDKFNYVHVSLNQFLFQGPTQEINWKVFV